MRKKFILITFGLLIFLFFFKEAFIGKEKFPPPEFSTEYQIPLPIYPEARADIFAYIDVIILILAILLAAYFAIKKRSRNHIYLLGLFSIAYFGFYKGGCICPIGSIQNVSVSIFDSSFILSLGALLFFLIPLISALYLGRTFCAAVCPLGGLQEVVIYKPLQIPMWLEHILGLIPFIYLSLAVLYAATGTSFIICKYDPFIPFFRLAGPYWIFIIGATFLLVGLFIARPYCRFFCPYGALLGIMSKFSKYHLSITPSQCIQCKLCENACPVNAIDKPSPLKYNRQLGKEINKLVLILFLVPVVMLVFGYGFSRMSVIFSKPNRVVSLAEQIYRENKGYVKEPTLQSQAFRARDRSIEDLYQEAAFLQKKFYTGSWLMGLFIGLIFSIKLINLIRLQPRKDYQTNKFNCISCGRCMDFCPVLPGAPQPENETGK